jgi:hypothetical protein
MLIPVEILIALPCSVVAYVYTDILLESGKILDWLGLYLMREHADASNDGKRLKERLFYMLQCSLCMSGQFSLWMFLIIAPFNIFSLIFTISLSILLTKFIQRWS